MPRQNTVNFCGSGPALVRGKMAVSGSHLCRAVTGQLGNCVQGHTRHGQPRTESMPERVKNNAVPGVGDAVIEANGGHDSAERVIGCGVNGVAVRIEKNQGGFVCGKSGGEERGNAVCHGQAAAACFCVADKDLLASDIDVAATQGQNFPLAHSGMQGQPSDVVPFGATGCKGLQKFFGLRPGQEASARVVNFGHDKAGRWELAREQAPCGHLVIDTANVTKDFEHGGRGQSSGQQVRFEMLKAHCVDGVQGGVSKGRGEVVLEAHILIGPLPGQIDSPTLTPYLPRLAKGHGGFAVHVLSCGCRGLGKSGFYQRGGAVASLGKILKNEGAKAVGCHSTLPLALQANGLPDLFSIDAVADVKGRVRLALPVGACSGIDTGVPSASAFSVCHFEIDSRANTVLTTNKKQPLSSKSSLFAKARKFNTMGNHTNATKTLDAAFVISRSSVRV